MPDSADKDRPDETDVQATGATGDGPSGNGAKTAGAQTDVTASETDGAGGDGAGTPSDEAPSRARRALRYVLYAVGGLIGLVVGLVVVLLLVLQTGAGAQWAVDTAIDLANPYEDATLTVGDVGGSFVGGLALYNVDLTREDGVRMAHVDTVRLSYRLLPLLNSRLDVGEVYVAGPELALHQRADSTWDLLAPFADTTAAQPDTTSGGFAIEVGEITLRRASVSADFYAGGRDSTLRMQGLNARVTDLLLGDALGVSVDTLYGRYEQTGVPGPVELGLGARLEDNRFTLSGLRLDSPNSDVRGRGVLRLPEGEGDTVDDIDFTLQAAPLSFRDLRPFAPSLAPEGSLSLDVQAQGSGRLVRADVQAALADGGTSAGSVNLDVTATPTTEGPLQYNVAGEVRGLALGVFTSGAAPDTAALAGTVNADLAVDLEGPALDALDGTADVALFDTRIGEFALDRTSVQARFTDGQAELDLQSGLRGLTVALAGTARPFNETPSYDLDGRLRNLDLSRFTADTTQQSDLNLALGLEGEGADLASADTDVRLVLEPSTLSGYALQGGTADFRLEGGDVLFDLLLNLENGALVAAEGQADLQGELEYQVSEGRFEDVDVAALTGDTTRSSLSGTFSLQGRGSDPETLSLEAALALADSYYGPYELNEVGLNAAMQAGRLRADVNADLDGGLFNLAATARPFAQTPTFAVTEGAFEDVDVGALTGNPAQSSSLSGTLSVEGRGFDPQTMTLDARLDLAASQLNEQEIESATVAAALRNGSLDYRLALDLPQGTTTLAGSAAPFGEPLTYAVREGSFNGLDVGALLGNPALSTDLNGTLALDGRGSDVATMSLQARLGLDRSQINDAVILGGPTTLSLQDGLANFSSDVDLGEGQIRLEGEGRFMDERPTYRAEGRIENLNLAAFLGADTLRSDVALGFEVEGEGTDPATMDVRGQLASDGIRYDSVEVDLIDVRFRVGDGLARVDTLLLSSNVARVTGGGQIAVSDSLPRPSDFSLAVDLVSLQPVQPLLGADILSMGESQIRARVYGRPGRMRFEATAEVNSFIYDAIRLAGLDARLAGEMGPDRTLRAAEADLELGYLSASAIDVERSTLGASYSAADQEVDFETEFVLDGDREAGLVGAIDLRPERQLVSFETFGLRFGEDQWRLLQDATIAYGDAYRISNFLLYTDSPEGAPAQQIAIDGVVDPDGEQNLVFTIDGFRLDAVTDLFGFDALGGTLGGAIDLTGPASDPDLDGALRLDLLALGAPAGELDLRLAYDSLRMRLDATLANVDGSTLRAEGTLPLDLRLEAPAADSAATAQRARFTTAESDPSSEVDFAVVADSFSLAWARPFLDPATVEGLGGAIIADIDVGGTLDGPVLDGTARLVGGRLGLPDLGVDYRRIGAEVTFQENRVLLENLSMRSGEGRLTGGGRIDLPELTLGEFSIDLALSEFLAIDSREYRAVLGGDLEVSGTTQAPILSGGLNVLSADVYLLSDASGSAPTGIEDVTLTAEDLQTVEERFGVRVDAADTTTSDVFTALAMDVGVSMERDLWIRSPSNPELQIQFTGSLDLQKEPGEELPRLFGEIEVLEERSFVRQFGRRFTLTTGTIRFNGPVDAPYLDLVAAYEVPSRNNQGAEVNITLSLEGNLADLGAEGEERVNLELGSEPELSQADIACYLALNRPCGAGAGTGGDAAASGGLGGAATDAVLGQVAGLVEGLAGSELGLDVIEIQQDGLRGATLTAGKYLSRRLYAAIRQPISFSSGSARAGTGEDVATEVIIEYELFEWLLLRLSRDGSTLRGNLLWEYAY